MSVRWWFAPLVVVAAVTMTAAAGCTVDGLPAATPSGGASATASGPGGGLPCPWSEIKGQEYEPENGRVKLVRTCLAARDISDTGGFVYRAAATADRADRYSDGTIVAVVCVEANGERYLDNGGHASTMWFRVDGEFAGGEGQAWVPHAAAGYAKADVQDPCSGPSASASASPSRST